MNTFNAFTFDVMLPCQSGHRGIYGHRVEVDARIEADGAPVIEHVWTLRAGRKRNVFRLMKDDGATMAVLHEQAVIEWRAFNEYMRRAAREGS